MATQPEPIRNAARAVRRTDRLGEQACCLLCGTRELRILVRVPLSGLVDAVVGVEPGTGAFRANLKLVLQEHHLLEETIDRDVKVPLCRNCHALAHEALRDLGIDFKADPETGTLLHVIQTVLRVLSWFHEQLARFLRSLADRIPALIDALDAAYPTWRMLPEVPGP
jgi:hypothetical protein